MSYNTRELTLDCLRSVYAQTHDVSFEVLVVDNASADGSAQAIAAEFPCIRLFLLHDNRGFAAANNLAGQHATGEWLLLLNPDTVILDRAIDKLLASAKEHSAIRPQYGIFGGRTLFPDGRLNPTSAWRRPTVWSLLSTASGLSASFRRTAFFNGEAMGGWPCDCVRAVDIVTGCFLLLRRALWERLGGFDLAFFMYGEDADLCLRARRLGVGCLICPDATIVHLGGASEKVRADKIVRVFRAKAQLFERHWSRYASALGRFTLDLWALTRAVAFGVARFLRPQYLEQYRTWRTVLANRAQWHPSKEASSAESVGGF